MWSIADEMIIDNIALHCSVPIVPSYEYFSSNIMRTLHDCPSQMNENLLISNSKLTSDSELIWWR